MTGATTSLTQRAVEEAEQRLTEFEAKWDAGYPPIGQS